MQADVDQEDKVDIVTKQKSTLQNVRQPPLEADPAARVI